MAELARLRRATLLICTRDGLIHRSKGALRAPLSAKGWTFDDLPHQRVVLPLPAWATPPEGPCRSTSERAASGEFQSHCA